METGLITIISFVLVYFYDEIIWFIIISIERKSKLKIDLNRKNFKFFFLLLDEKLFYFFGDWHKVF